MGNDDCWVDMYDGGVSLDERNITIYPTKDPKIAWKENEVQINPYMQIFLLNRVYLPMWKSKLDSFSDEFQMAIQTTFNTKSVYTE
jgi:hypothetical protein